MRTTIRDIIINSCDETGLRNRNQPVPANIMESAYLLLKKRLAQYSNTNFLSFTRKEVNFKSEKEMVTLGEFVVNDEYEGQVIIVKTMNDRPAPSSDLYGKYCFIKEDRTAYYCDSTAQWNEVSDPSILFESYPDIEVQNLQEVVRVFSQYTGTPDWDEMNFVAYEDFYRFNRTANVYSYKPVSESLIELYIPKGYTQYNLKLIYNEFFDFNMDSELNLPGQFIALFTAGLVYDLAITYPRLSDTTVALFKSRLDELEENCRRSSSVNKFIARKVSRNTFTMSDFYNGRFIRNLS